MSRIRIKADIDCPNCAKKVEAGLNKSKDIENAVFDFKSKTITLESNLSEAKIKEICRNISDEISFPDDIKKEVFIAEIDCPNCALKVEKAIKTHPDVKNASFIFTKNKLIVESTLSRDEIKALARKIDDEIIFHEKKSNDENILLYRIGLSIVIFIISLAIKVPYLAILSYVIAGYDVILKAGRNILKGEVFDENFLMAIATIGALFISSYDEAAGVMIFYQIGEFFQHKAVDKSRKSIAELMDLDSDSANVIRDGIIETVTPDKVSSDEIILIRAGERIPIDGVVIKGESYLDTKALTGEAKPVKAEIGTAVLSGSINKEGTLEVRTTALYKDSTASMIKRLTEESEGKKAKSEKFITRFSRYYTPFVCVMALLLAIVPPIIGIAPLTDSLYRACMLLVISCPCALVLSVPLTYFASMGCFAKNGILVKGDDAIQKLSKLSILALDKTGTLTEGVFKVREVKVFEGNESELLSIASALEKNSTHPIAKAIVEYAGNSNLNVTEIREIPGSGIYGKIGNDEVFIGKDSSYKYKTKGSLAFVKKNERLLGVIAVYDKTKEDSYKAIAKLRKSGIKKIVMLTGDRKESAESVSEQLKLDFFVSNLLPDGKITEVEKLLKDGETVGFAGDGINDAPTLRRADIGIAMGGVGSDAAIEASDAVIMNDDISKIADGIAISRKTESIVRQNIFFSLATKAAVFVLAILGISSMWLAVFADTGVALLAVANAMRAMNYKDHE